MYLDLETRVGKRVIIVLPVRDKQDDADFVVGKLVSVEDIDDSQFVWVQCFYIIESGEEKREFKKFGLFPASQVAGLYL